MLSAGAVCATVVGAGRDGAYDVVLDTDRALLTVPGDDPTIELLADEDPESVGLRRRFVATRRDRPPDAEEAPTTSSPSRPLYWSPVSYARGTTARLWHDDEHLFLHAGAARCFVDGPGQSDAAPLVLRAGDLVLFKAGFRCAFAVDEPIAGLGR